ALLALFIYESSIVVLALLCGYLAILWLRKPDVINRRFLFVFGAGAALCAALFVAARFLAVQIPARITPPALVVKNTALYAGALLVPVDTVLAHDLLGTPLPSEMRLDLRSPVLWAGGLMGLVVCFALTIWIKKRTAEGATPDWPVLLFLLAAGGLALLPFLLFNAHPSETYLP